MRKCPYCGRDAPDSSPEESGWHKAGGWILACPACGAGFSEGFLERWGAVLEDQAPDVEKVRELMEETQRRLEDEILLSSGRRLHFSYRGEDSDGEIYRVRGGWVVRGGALFTESQWLCAAADAECLTEHLDLSSEYGAAWLPPETCSVEEVRADLIV